MKILESTYVVFDFEATYSPNIGYHEIIEIGAHRLERGTLKIVDSFFTLVKPTTPIIIPIIKKTGITDIMVKNSPIIEQVWEEFWNFCHNSIMVGHQVGFDRGVLEKTANIKGLKKFENIFIDTLGLTKKLYPNEASYSLESLQMKYKIKNTVNHRAPDDAIATAYIFQAIVSELQNRFEYDTIEQIENFMSKANSQQISLF